MDLTPYLNNLRDDLNTTASAGDDATKRAAAVLSAALEPAARLAIMNALSDLAAEVTAGLEDRVVDVRLDGRDVRVVVSGSRGEDRSSGPAGGPPPPPPPPFPPGGGDISRMTLRLFEELKSKAEQAAAEQGVSLNTFVQQAVQGALHGKREGWGGSWGGPWGHGGSWWEGGPSSEDDPEGPRRRGRRRPPEEGDSLHGWVQA